MNKSLLKNTIFLIIYHFSEKPISIDRLTKVLFLSSNDYYKKYDSDFLSIEWEKTSEGLFSREIIEFLLNSNQFECEVNPTDKEIESIEYVGGQNNITFDNIRHLDLSDFILKYIYSSIDELDFFINRVKVYKEAQLFSTFKLDKTRESEFA